MRPFSFKNWRRATRRSLPRRRRPRLRPQKLRDGRPVRYHVRLTECDEAFDTFATTWRTPTSSAREAAEALMRVSAQRYAYEDSVRSKGAVANRVGAIMPLLQELLGRELPKERVGCSPGARRRGARQAHVRLTGLWFRAKLASLCLYWR